MKSHKFEKPNIKIEADNSDQDAESIVFGIEQLKQSGFSVDDLATVKGYLGGKLNRDEIRQHFVEKAEYKKEEEAIVEESMQKLKEIGILEEQGEFLIMDLNRFLGKNENFDEKESGVGNIMRLMPIYERRNSITRRDMWQSIYRLFLGKKIISKEDWEKGMKKSKSLFWDPKTEEDFSIEEIKNAEFYLLPHEYGQKLNDPIPFMQNGATLVEASIAGLMYHPNFGNGHRDDRGMLWVQDNKTKQYKPLSYSFFHDHGLIGGNVTKYGESMHQPKAFVRNRTKFLMEKELLLPSDFKVVSGSVTSKHERIEKNTLNTRGVIMFNGIRHYLGRELAEQIKDNFVRTIQLDNGLGGIIVRDGDGQEMLGYTFNILPFSSGLKIFKDGHAWAGKDKTEPRKYNPKEKVVRRADEKIEDYQKRVEALENFDLLLSFSQELQEQTGVRIFDFSFEFQKTIIGAIRSLKDKRPEIINFAQEHGENGLKAFLSCEYGEENGEKIIEMAKKLDNIQAKEIFNEYSQIVDLAEELKIKLDESSIIKEVDFPENIQNIFSAQIYEGILRRAKDLLIAPYPILVEKKKTDFETKDIILALNGLRKILEIIINLNKAKLEKNEQDGKMDNFFYRIEGDDGYLYGLRIGIRPEETEGAQARINFELNFNTNKPNRELKEAFSQEIIYKKDNKKRKISRLRVAIDRETIGGKEEVSLDMGRDKRDDKDFTRTGDIMGKILSFVSKTGHHNPDSFNPKLAERETFKKLAEVFKQYLISHSAK